jgi:tRNA A-37 threonylcarbamoyl transferase component Bud32
MSVRLGMLGGMSEPDEPPSGRTLANGRYQLIDRLGRGGMAEVWRAYDTQLRVKRAVKILSGDGRGLTVRAQRLRTEARAMVLADSRHVLRVYDILEEDGRPVIVMDLAPGGSLDDRLRDGGPLSPQQASRWMCDVLLALQAAHTIGVIHRDVKPSNVLIDGVGRAVLADFGIALIDQDPERQTRTGITMGSMAFMAPEQRLDARGVGPAADVYAVATSLYHLITGATPVDLFLAEPASPRWDDVPRALAPILQRATHLRPEERYPSAAALREALEAVVEGLPAAPVVGAPQPPGGDTRGGEEDGTPFDETMLPARWARPGPERIGELSERFSMVGVGAAAIAVAMGLLAGIAWLRDAEGAAEVVVLPAVEGEAGSASLSPTAEAAADAAPPAPTGSSIPDAPVDASTAANKPAAPTPSAGLAAEGSVAPRPKPAAPAVDADPATARAGSSLPPGFADADVSGGSGVAGRWQGMLGQRAQLLFALAGEDGKVVGTVWSSKGGQFSSWKVAGRMEGLTLVLTDLTDTYSGGEYRLDPVPGGGLAGTFARRGADGGRASVVDVQVWPIR